MLGRQPIVDRDHADLGLIGQLAAQAVVAVEVADDPAPTVHIEQRRQRSVGSSTGAAVDAQLEVACGCRNALVAHRGHILGWRLQDVPGAGISLAGLVGGQRFKWRAAGLTAQFEQAGQIGIVGGHDVLLGVQRRS